MGDVRTRNEDYSTKVVTESNGKNSLSGWLG
ncbi:MAG: hypothetical protein ACI8W8_002644, partial [Rhodothermales bacterium]